MQFNCSFGQLLEIDSPKLILNPKNNNRHSIEQIERLAKIIDFQGQRSPIVISKESGFIVKGHCRLEAIKLLGWEKVAVDFQSYINQAQEYADMTADNEIARWAEFDTHKAIEDLKHIDLGDIELLGFEDSDFISQSLGLTPVDDFKDFLDKNSGEKQKIVTILLSEDEHTKFMGAYEAHKQDEETLKDYLFRVTCG